MAAADRNDVAATTAATSTGAWLAHATVQPPGAAHAEVKLAVALDESFAATRETLADGELDQDRARVVVGAVQALPADALEREPDLVVRAEKHMLELARVHDARQLKQLGRHLHHVLDPDAADELLGRQLEEEERAAARATYLEMHDNGDGTHTGRWKIPTRHAAMLRRALESLTNPAARATGVAAEAPKPSRPEVLGQVFCELIERLDPDRLPQQGGVNATVVVTVDLDRLLSGLGTARLDTGEPISAGEARRLACQAGVIPAVVRRLVDGSSVVLDMGRGRRFHTEHMRIALGLQGDGQCATDGCTRPAGWCHAHHLVAWSKGGGTSLDNGLLLCPFHHSKAHTATHDMHRLPTGAVRFTRRL